MKGETGIILHSGGKGEYIWSAGAPLTCPLISSGPIIKVNVKPTMTKSNKDDKCPQTFRNEGIADPPGNEPRSAEILTKG